MQSQRSRFLKSAIFSLVLTLALTLSGCGSLSRILEQPAPPRENTESETLSQVPRAGEEYEGVEILHGTWDEPQQSPDSKAYFYEERGWIYLYLEGEPANRGYQYGWLLADYIQLNIDQNKALLAELYALDWEYLRTHAERLWAGVVSEEYQAELEGIVEGASQRGADFDYVDLLVLNGLEELCCNWFPTVQSAYYAELARGLWKPEVSEGAEMPEGYEEREGLTGVPFGNEEDNEDNEDSNDTALADTGVADHAIDFDRVYTKEAVALLATGEATEEGTLVLAHNTIASYAGTAFYNVWITIDPADGQQFTMQAAPGCIASGSEFYETESLIVAATRIQDFCAYNEVGTPEFLRVREAVQYSESPDEFTKTLLEQNNGGLASSWLVGELETNEIMKLELGLSFYSTETLTNGCFISTGEVGDERIRATETTQSALSDARTGSSARSTRMTELVDAYYGTLAVETAQVILSDHYDSYQEQATASLRSICAHGETDDARFTNDPSISPYMPYGAIDAKVISSELAKEHTVVARWGNACGRAFDSAEFLERHQHAVVLTPYLYDRPSEPWNEFYPYGG